ncbi:MAG TPA: Rpn family recombination-promoting nuclease/putative transposase [Planctomycetaceae bacterium]|nr:Rpn family recombination-promoting nuclease/putative transposase [Planctomycetaceae bacterium]
MTKSRLRRLVRQFPENGIKLLLENPANVRELLSLAGTDVLDLLDLDQMRLLSTTFVARDFRHVEADVVLEVPVRRRRGARQHRRSVLVYVLIEHQSQPDELMPFRLLEYTVQICRRQLRQHSEQPDEARIPPLDPVLPVVLYTGTRAWKSPGTMDELFALGSRFRKFIPVFEPLFLNVGALSADIVEAEGGALGPVLRLLRARKARVEEFQTLLTRAVERLGAMASEEWARWVDLLSYLHALVYFERPPSERPRLQRTIEGSVHTDRNRREIRQMGKTIAEALMEKGRRQERAKQKTIAEAFKEEGRREEMARVRQQTLLRQLRRRFKDLPVDIVQAVESTQDIERLDTWLDRFATATCLEDVGIGPET